jgi:hypothetical protein
MTTTLLKRSLTRSLTLGLLALAITSTATSQTVATEGCFAPAQSLTGPVAITLWCQILDYSGASPLAASWDTGPVTLVRGFTATSLHVEYDPWYAAMDSTFQLEFLRAGGQDIVLQPFIVSGSSASFDIPVSLAVAAGDRFRIIQQSAIAHPCGPIDNCGLHAVFTFQ